MLSKSTSFQKNVFRESSFVNRIVLYPTIPDTRDPKHYIEVNTRVLTP